MSADDGGREFGIFDLLAILLKRKWLIAGVTLCVASLMVITSLNMKPVFRAETSIIIPQPASSAMASMMVSQLGISPGALNAAAPSLRAHGEMYMEMIKSRTILDRMVNRFGLLRRYQTTSREIAREALGGGIKARNNFKSGVITVFVEDTDPRMAADMANALVEELRMMVNGLSITEAAQRRLYFEEQLVHARDGLAKAEEAMKAFQEKTGVVKIDSQADAAITGVSMLRAQIAAKEVQLRAMRTFSTEQNPDLVMTREELSGLKDQLSRLEAKSSGGDVFVPTGNIPATSAEFLRKARDLKFNETLYMLLMNQCQVAKLDEARDTAVIQVLDKAVPPETRIKPRRRSMAMVGVFLGLLLSLVVVGLLEFKDPFMEEFRARMKGCR